MSMQYLSARWSWSVRARAALVAALATLSAGCVQARTQPTLSPEVLAEASTGVVAVAAALDDDEHVTLCSGAVVAPNLVLTARHCVSQALTATPSCDADGRSHNGLHLARDLEPSRISIYAGPRVRPESDVPIARAERTLHPKSHVLCDADVAFLVLDRPLIGVRVLPLRLHGAVEAGDHVVPVGFGGGAANLVGLRVARRGGRVLAVGPAANARTGAVLGPREFEVDRATCRGDSGGPAIDAQTGEIVGVVSRGGSCLSSGNHVYTRVDAYGRLATQAFATARAAALERLARVERDDPSPWRASR